MQRIRYDNIEWHLPTESREDLDLSSAPTIDEPARKFLVEGEAGFHVQTVRIPANFTAPVHHHDHPEVFMVLDGSCVFDGTEMGRFDIAVVEAGEPYGFTTGDLGVQFLVTRTAIATFETES